MLSDRLSGVEYHIVVEIQKSLSGIGKTKQCLELLWGQNVRFTSQIVSQVLMRML